MSKMPASTLKCFKARDGLRADGSVDRSVAVDPKYQSVRDDRLIESVGRSTVTVVDRDAVLHSIDRSDEEKSVSAMITPFEWEMIQTWRKNKL